MDVTLAVAIAAGVVAAVALGLALRSRAAEGRRSQISHDAGLPQAGQVELRPAPEAPPVNELSPVPRSFLVPVDDPSTPDLFVSVGDVATLDLRDRRQLDLLPPSVRRSR